MRDIVFTFVIILATVGLIALIRLATKGLKDQCRRPKAELRIFFDENCECLEYTLGMMLNSSALESLNLRVVIVDTVNTDDSRKWLCELRRKLGYDFDTETEDDRNGIADSYH